MTLFNNKYRIESTRLKGWDYSSPGYYFITICTANKKQLFGEISSEDIKLNEFGNMVNHCWYDLPNHYTNITLDEFIIMPNHIHGIIIIETNLKPVYLYNHSVVETGFKPVSTDINTAQKKRHGLFEIVRALKTFSARRINELRNTPGVSIWQPRFFDRVIRNEEELHNTREYIIKNPKNWLEDENYWEYKK